MSVERSELLKQLRIDRDEARARSRGRLLAVGVVALLLVAAGLWFFVGRQAKPAVRTAVARAVSQGPGAGSVLDASGYVTARRQATVSAKITGKVTEVTIEEGMRVKDGEILARLDDTEARAALALARAQLGAARSQLVEIRATLAQAERDYTRQPELLRSQLVSERSMDAALAQGDALRAKLGSAGEGVRVAQEAVRAPDVRM